MIDSLLDFEVEAVNIFYRPKQMEAQRLHRHDSVFQYHVLDLSGPDVGLVLHRDDAIS
jgi:hypothetical protein